ncbi:hypothetical protein ET495_06420 [Xylanimonas allomyrinae]|uniref:Tim44-like domain-containing protein n=1 Tax=Xylanimonas allomyrinae TaxID=2509459 RepID=A0A4P6EKK2_9MICO|nr:hypothetical protein [Xylanimonas allomyrinae]QAY62935.1 hypothetical protein ET495_06420 [Xylanimonas allomyrinae]
MADVGAVDVAGSPAHQADTALLARLDASGTRPERPRATVTDATVVAVGGSSARVRVAYVVEAHVQVAADGSRTAVGASRPHESTLDLRWTAGGWRVEGVA